MKKFASLLFMLLLLVALPVSAEKIKFKDSNYDFSHYSNIQMMGITSVEIDRTDFEVDPTAEGKLRMTLLQAFDKKKRAVVEQTEEDKVSPKLGFTAKIYVFGNDKIWHDAWVETVNTSKTIYIDDYDKHGNLRRKAISIPVTQYVDHPAGYYYTARVDIEFNVTDLRTNKLVYSVRDTRSRGGGTDTSGMLKRICGDFVDDIAK